MARKSVTGIDDVDRCCPQVLTAPLDTARAEGLARAFAALGDPVRLKLLSLIATAESGEVCVCDLVPPVGRAQPTVSHHLKVLADAGLVVADKRGKWSWYSVVPGRLEQLGDALAPSKGPVNARGRGHGMVAVAVGHTGRP